MNGAERVLQTCVRQHAQGSPRGIDPLSPGAALSITHRRYTRFTSSPDVEINPDSAQGSGLQFLTLDSVAIFEKPGPESLYLAEGVPAELASIDRRTISLTSLGYMTIPAVTEGLKHRFRQPDNLIGLTRHAPNPQLQGPQGR